jgi:hypothetical protein
MLSVRINGHVIESKIGGRSVSVDEVQDVIYEILTNFVDPKPTNAAMLPAHDFSAALYRGDYYLGSAIMRVKFVPVVEPASR